MCVDYRKRAGNLEKGVGGQKRLKNNKQMGGGSFEQKERESNEDIEMPQKIFAFKKIKIRIEVFIRVFFSIK